MSLEYQTARQVEGHASAKTINLEVSTLRAIMRKHLLWAPIQAKVSLLEARSDVGRALSRDEETQLLLAAQASRSRSLYPAILLSMHTGLRNRELRTLQWKLVNLLDGHITVGASKTLAGKGRIVPLSALALTVLREWRALFPDALPEHYVFPSEKIGLRGEQGYQEGASVAYVSDPTKPMGSWKTAFAGALRKAKMRCRWHDLRHHFLSRIAEGGAPEQTMLALAGHMTRRMLERYSHIRMESKRKAVTVFDVPQEIRPNIQGVGTKVGTVQ